MPDCPTHDYQNAITTAPPNSHGASGTLYLGTVSGFRYQYRYLDVRKSE